MSRLYKGSHLWRGWPSTGKLVRVFVDVDRQPAEIVTVYRPVGSPSTEVERLRAAGVSFRTSEIVSGPGCAQVIIDDPSGNPIELFQPRR